MVEYLILDYEREEESTLLLNSIKQYSKFSHTVTFLSNGGSQDYVKKLKNQGLIDKLILNEVNVGCGAGTIQLFAQYAQALAEKDAKDKGLKLVDIGGGLNPRPGYLTIDQEGAEINCDLNDGIPLPDNSVGVINASHVIEHLRDKTKTMREIHRVLAHGGWAFIEVPSTDGRGAFQDPTHVSYWNENSFLYYTNAYLGNFIRNKDIKFQEYRRETWFPNEWLKSINVPVTTAWLVANKEGGKRLPHTKNI